MTVHKTVSKETYGRVRRLMRDLGSALSALCPEIEDTPEPKGERAARLWIIYSLIHLADFLESAAQLTDEKHARAIAVLSRTTYEYVVSMIYLYRHKDIADAQMLTQGARFYARGMQMHLPTGSNSRDNYLSAYDEWVKDANDRTINEYTGNFKFQSAAFEVEQESKERSPIYSMRYGLTSTVAHPDAAGFPDTFHIDNEAHTIDIGRKTSLHAFDLLFMMMLDAIRAIRFIQDEVGVEVEDLALLQRRVENVGSEHFTGVVD